MKVVREGGGELWNYHTYQQMNAGAEKFVLLNQQENCLTNDQTDKKKRNEWTRREKNLEVKVTVRGHSM